MPILISDLKVYGTAVMPDDDVVEEIGGAIDESRKPTFADLVVNGLVQGVSSAPGDTTQALTVHFKNVAGIILSETKTLTGQTPVAFAATMRTLMKALKGATTAGDVAVEAVTSERTDTAQGDGGGTDTIQLDADASAIDHVYLGMVIRITGGAGAGQIREIKSYVGSTRLAYVNRPWGTGIDGTSVFRIARGLVFDLSPSEIFEVRRIGYNVAADDAFGATRHFYEKIFVKNTHASLSLQSAQVAEFDDPTGTLTFGVAASLDDTGTNGPGNTRQVAPAGITFDNNTKNMATGELPATAAQGIWIKQSLPAGASAAKSTYTLQAIGISSA